MSGSMPERRKARQSRLAGVLAGMEERLGPQRLAAILRRVVDRRPRAAAPLSRERLALVSSLFARGQLDTGVREAAALLSARPANPPGTLIGSVQSVLAMRGWTVCSRTAQGDVRFVVRRAGEEADLFEIVLESRRGAVSGDALSIMPVFRLRPFRRGGSRELQEAEKAGLEELSSALGLLLESLWGQADRTDVLSQAETHQGKEGRDILLRTTLACNQRCPFCFVPLTRNRLDPVLIERELESLARWPGPRGVLMLSGGEPTVDPNLPQVIESARRKGFRRFVLQTNGVLLARPGLLEKLVRLGVWTYMVSFHSHKPEHYDQITGSRGQFRRAVAGMTRLIHEKRCCVTVNVVVCARNYRDLPGLMGFLGRLSAHVPRKRRPVVYFSMINEIGHEKAPSWAVSLERIAPYLRRAVERCRREGLRVEEFAGESTFPVCLLKEPRRFASQRIFPQDRVRYAEDFPGMAGAVGRAKRPACRLCPYDTKCLGVPAQYAQMFGLGALRVPRK